MTVPADARLDEILSAHGRMNFSQNCTVSDHAARLTMDDKSVFLATVDNSGSVASAAFLEVQVSGSGTTRTITVGAPHDVTFDSEASCERFLRVLGVRQDVLAPRPAASLADKPGQARSGSTGGGGSARAATPAVRYKDWCEYALLASTFLLLVAWLDLVIGAIFAVVLFFGGSPLAGLIWLLVAAAGFSLPACVGSATRMIVYRFQMEDAAR
jgi:hypothetical protein